ncbi:MAG: hypothetical protein KAQ85_01085 [Thermodesulfovibrionia bacterium]|nr:hypothetical protein [Thermodesulfovibrionia bacterium]
MTEWPETYPPKLKPAVCVPAPASPYLAVANAPPEDHAVPLYSSVTAETEELAIPPKLNPDD